jgi:FMN phosphatase YigB (HAD superfamily)
MKTSGSHRIALYPEIERFFETIIVAGESGVPAKPDPKPFRLCMEKMHISPAEAMYIGDDFQKDVCGAGDAGLYPVWIKHRLVKRTWPQPETYAEAPVITDLTELVAMGSMGD